MKNHNTRKYFIRGTNIKVSWIENGWGDKMYVLPVKEYKGVDIRKYGTRQYPDVYLWENGKYSRLVDERE